MRSSLPVGEPGSNGARQNAARVSSPAAVLCSRRAHPRPTRRHLHQLPCRRVRDPGQLPLTAGGIDIPSVDAVVFADPTRSVIRCVRALGRALRLDVSGKTASLIVPVHIPPGADPENILGTAYEPVWAIATVLASHDHRILERLVDKANRLLRETSQLIEHRWHFDFTVHPERIAPRHGPGCLRPLRRHLPSRRAGLAAAQAFHDQYGHLNVPADYTDTTGDALGCFITGMRDAVTAGRLDAARRAELGSLNMIWDKHEAAWRAQLTTVADYHPPAGAFLAERRSPATRGELTLARAADLTSIDPNWRLPHGAVWHRKYNLLRAHLTAGNDPTALRPDTVLGAVRIGTRLGRQLTRWADLHPGRQHLLTEIGQLRGTAQRPP
ncbi:Helicase associated domain protein [Streptomyces sp. Agncl-13]|uniref:helicase associated domain-containing protein n=1 Tax=Streptomyces sp. Agncl-13 TaxID=3400628 RepID=UPI003A858C64